MARRQIRQGYRWHRFGCDFAFLNSFQHNNYVTFSLLYALLRENHKIVFPYFIKAVNATCNVWRRLWTRECFLTKTSTVVERLVALVQNIEFTSSYSLFKNLFQKKLSSYKHRSSDLHLKSVGWLLYSINIFRVNSFCWYFVLK